MSTLMIIAVILAMTAGAVWRLVDGHGWGPTAVRVPLAFIIAAAAALLSVGETWWIVWLAGWAGLNIIVGHTDWSDFLWMPLRFGSVAALTILPYGTDAWLYVALCAIAGLCYPLFMILDLPKVTIRGVQVIDGQEAWARLPAGAFIIGGLALL